MKTIVLLVLILSFPVSGFARSEAPQVTNEEVLDTSSFLPPPPAMDSLIMQNDRAQYEHGLTLRKTPRGEQATLDANFHNFSELFSEAFGYQISPETTPEIYALLKMSTKQIDKGATALVKKKYMRVRPYMLYNTGTCYPKDEEKLRLNGSYPSGHSAKAWGFALILAEINPARKDEIFKRGYEMGQSRVICGYHWQSDVDAARMSSSASVAILHTKPEFLAQMEKAKKECAALKIEK